MTVLFWSLMALCCLTLLSTLGWQCVKLQGLKKQLAAEFVAGERQHEANAAQQAEASRVRFEQATDQAEAAHRARLQNPDFLSGNLASNRHATEWKLRLGHSAQVATTALETNLIAMDQLGRDPAVTAKEALEKVAGLAAPAGSRVEVMPHEERFVIRVAFSMSALAAREAGAVTKHTSRESLRREIEQLSARVMRDIYDSCGWRGVEKVTVSCNHALFRWLDLPGATPEEKEELARRAPTVMGRLYRVSLTQEKARAVPDWRSVSTARLIGMFTVEHDGVSTLNISSERSETSQQADPAGPLEF